MYVDNLLEYYFSEHRWGYSKLGINLGVKIKQDNDT